MNDEVKTDDESVFAGIKAHPWITGIFIFCVILWTVIAIVFLPEEWAMIRKVAAGLIWGLFCAIIVTATRTVGNTEDLQDKDG